MVIIINSLRGRIITSQNTLYNQTSGRWYGKKSGKYASKNAKEGADPGYSYYAAGGNGRLDDYKCM